MDRVILHCDCNSFFASVETALNPQYNNVPMAVCGSQAERHGIVLAKNELAKKYGIVTAETVYSAKRKCPKLVIAEPHYNEYMKYSKRVNQIYYEYTDLVEPFGIDESWLDVTASQRIFGSGEKIADEIRRRVKSEIGITVSVGVSFNKIFAKLGSDYKKPDAVTVISRENYKSIVFPLPARYLLFVGKRTAEELKTLGVRTIGELSAMGRDILIRKFGKMGELLHIYSNGLDSSPVSPATDNSQKSVSNGLTFSRDITTKEECRIGIDFLCEEIGYKLRARGQRCTAVALTIKDEYLKSIQRQRRLSAPSDISAEIAEAAYQILLDEWSPGKPVRMLTVSAMGLLCSDSYKEQIDMFSDGREEVRAKSKKKEETIDIIRQKHGNLSIIRGAVMKTDIGIYRGKDK